MNENRSFPDGFALGGQSGSPVIDKRDTHYLARREDFAIGNTIVRPSIRTIEAPGGVATTEPRVMQVMLALIDATGDVVTREDLIHLCWKGQVVGDDSINRAVSELRKALRTSGSDIEVETIPRIGFRIPVPATTATLAATADETEELAPRPPFRALSRRGLLAAGAAIGVGAIGWLATRGASEDGGIDAMLDEARTAMRAGTPPNEARARALLEQAVVEAPQRADAWALLALTRARVVEHALTAPDLPFSAIEDASQRALRLDPANLDAQAALALATPYYGDWVDAERRYLDVLGKGEHRFARDSYCFFLGAVGRMEEGARGRFAHIEDTPPDANLHFRTIYAHWFLGQIAEADRVAARGLAMWPRQPGAWFARLWVLAGTDRIDRALAHVRDELNRPPFPAVMFDTIEITLEAVRDPALRPQAIARIMGGVGTNVAAVVNAMMLLNLVGALDEAFALAQAYYLERGPILPAMDWRPGQPVVPDQRRRKTNMLFTPIAAAMQRDPRFMPLMENMGLVDYWRRTGSRPDFLS